MLELFFYISYFNVIFDKWADESPCIVIGRKYTRQIKKKKAK
jgi:hypothetical protein